MVSWKCRACTNEFAVGSARCPECREADAFEVGDEQETPVFDAARSDEEVSQRLGLVPALESPATFEVGKYSGPEDDD